MNKILNINNIINLLPTIFEYFVPGFLFLSSFCYLTSRKLPKNILIGSIAISYILKAVFSIFIKLQNWNTRAIILCTTALILSIICVKFTEGSKFNKYFRMINNKSTHDNMFSDVIDYKNGTTLRIMCNDYICTGKLLFHEEKGKDSWIVLTDYIIETESDESDINSTDVSYPSIVMLRISDIKYIQLYYNENNTIL